MKRMICLLCLCAAAWLEEQTPTDKLLSMIDAELSKQSHST